MIEYYAAPNWVTKKDDEFIGSSIALYRQSLIHCIKTNSSTMFPSYSVTNELNRYTNEILEDDT